jgi:hypothetical protein
MRVSRLLYMSAQSSSKTLSTQQSSERVRKSRKISLRCASSYRNKSRVYESCASKKSKSQVMPARAPKYPYSYFDRRRGVLWHGRYRDAQRRRNDRRVCVHCIHALHRRANDVRPIARNNETHLAFQAQDGAQGRLRAQGHRRRRGIPAQVAHQARGQALRGTRCVPPFFLKLDTTPTDMHRRGCGARTSLAAAHHCAPDCRSRAAKGGGRLLA